MLRLSPTQMVEVPRATQRFKLMAPTSKCADDPPKDGLLRKEGTFERFAVAMKKHLAYGGTDSSVLYAAHMRWRIERDYQALKLDLGSGHLKDEAGGVFTTTRL